MSAALPLVLAGPIVRLAYDKVVWFWVATSKKVVGIEPEFFSFDSSSSRKKDGEKLLLGPHHERRVGAHFYGNADFEHASLGKNLFVSMRAARPPEKKSFPTDTIIGYNLELTFEENNGSTFKKKITDLVSGISYSNYKVPTFTIAASPGVIAQCSCRRPGADGEDASTALDFYISIMQFIPKRRPASLFLTGDQIYADDVARSLFEATRKLSVDLMGYDEYMPRSPDSSGKIKFEQPAGNIVFHTGGNPNFPRTNMWRHKLRFGTRRTNGQDTGFTTQDGEGHLLTFGEFAAMYILVWNPELAKKYGVEKNLRNKDSQGDKNLRGFIKGIAAMRRVLANVPTYMTFDDHEVTDDWNISKKWLKNTDNLYARRIIANGLAAYWAFQGWGNTPDYQDPPNPRLAVLGIIESHLRKQLKSNGKLYRFNDRDYGKPMLAYHEWSYLAPSEPPVVVTDLRTERHHDRYKPSHLTRAAFDKLVFPKKGRPLVIVVASPLLNWKPMLTLRAADMLINGKRVDVEYGDLWDDVEGGRAQFIDWIVREAKPRSLVSLSGDVHYSHITKGTAVGTMGISGSEKWRLPLVQITCSPTKNQAAALNKKLVGVVSRANLAEELFDTAGTSAGFANHSTYVRIKYDALKFKGKLGHETIIQKNQICVMDFSKKDRVFAKFIGPKGSASAEIKLT